MLDTHDFDPRNAKQEWGKHKQRTATTRQPSSEFSIPRNAEINSLKERCQLPRESKLAHSASWAPVPSSVNGFTVKQQVGKPRYQSRASTYTTHFAKRQRDAPCSLKSKLSHNRSAQQTEAYTTETTRPILSGTSVRVRKAIQATEVSLGTGEGSSRKHAKTNIQPGQDLVPEQTVQMQEASAGKQSAHRWNGVMVWTPAWTAESSCTRAGQRRRTVLRERTIRVKYEHEYEHELRTTLYEHVPSTAEQPSSKQNMVNQLWW